MAAKMTIKQKFLKLVYPLLIFYQKIKGNQRIKNNERMIPPHVPLYSLSVELANGNIISLEKFKGRKIMIVNTASNCGYTAQYAELQKLYQHSKEDLEIIAFPSNEFGEQEKGSDKEIVEFCINLYSIRFLIAKKSSIKKSPQQNAVYRWLSDKDQNGWNEQTPEWNFSKYIINEEGILTHYFNPAISPVSEEMIKAVHQ